MTDTITIAELGRRYATSAARERDGVTVVWRNKETYAIIR